MYSVNVSVIIMCVMELLQIKFDVFDCSREITILLVETFQKQLLSLSKKKKKKKKKNCRQPKLLLTLVVKYKTRWLHRKDVFPYLLCNLNMIFIPVPSKTV